MTLHSISLIYPERPSYEDIEILKRFMSLFADTITCPDCKHHFVKMFESYKIRNPSWCISRREFFLFVARAHNTVNARIDKPRMATVAEAISTIRRNTTVTSGSSYRTSYINYLIRNWSIEQSGEAFIMRHSAKEINKINDEYWSPRDTGNADVFIEEDDILTPIIHVPMRQNYFTGQQVQTSTKMPSHVRVSFISKQLKLIRK